MKITYLFTTFPLLSESFLQREIEAMRDLGVELELYSLFLGGGEFQGLPVRRFRWWQWAKLPHTLLRECIRAPAAFRTFARHLRRNRPPEPLNLLETFLGFAFAVIHAPHFRKTGRHHVHAVWATGPATAALLLRDLAGIRFTMGAHAYDVFRRGGDWILEPKLAAASLIHTSTEATRTELLQRGAHSEKVVMIRRGLIDLPEMGLVRTDRATTPIRLLSVGRLVEKKGFDSLLRICAALREAGVPFECILAGGGPLAKRLAVLRNALGIESCVRLAGPLSFEKVQECYRWADLFCFTGRVAPDNDRDGLPNVLGEAMAFGLPVLSAPVSGTVEAIADGVTGRLLDPAVPEAWVQAIDALRENDAAYVRLREAARSWVETHFDARANAARLLEAFSRSDAAVADRCS
jgi:colanic acid/amylovoran biosynthesis glycosyltransferase